MINGGPGGIVTLMIVVCEAGRTATHAAISQSRSLTPGLWP